MMKYSLITCTYNAEQYIDHYFDVVEGIDFKDFEIIIVDDCSIDSTYEKILEKRKNSHIKVVLYRQNKNMGPGIARNKGIELSCGERFIFLDVDDKVDSNIFNVLDSYTEDCIFFNYYKWYSTGKLEKHSSLNGGIQSFVNIDDIMRRTTGAVWGKCFSSEIIKNNKVEFPALYKTEDLVFMISYLVNCETVAYCDKYVYYYRISDNSAMNTNIENQITNAEKAMEILKSILVDHIETYDIIYSKEITYDFTNIYIRLKKTKKELTKFWCDKNIKICSGGNRSYYSLIQKIVFVLIRFKCYRLLVILNKFR